MYTKDEVEKFRNPIAFLAWFDALLAKVNSDTTAKSEALLHQGKFKKFYEEIFPLACLLRAKCREWSNSEFRNVLGDQGHDVEIRSHQFRFFEIVCANFDDGESFRMQRLIDHGNVSSTAKIVRSSTNKPVGCEKAGDFRDHGELVSERIALVEDRIRRKSQKLYPDNTALVVYYDGASIQITSADAQKLSQTVSGLKPSWEPVFAGVFVVGSDSALCIEENRA